MKKSLNILHISKKSSNFAAGFINRNIRYSYDMRDMLTETRNKHFSERLFYADSLSLLPQSVAPCRNGNIAAAYISQLDSIYTFAYSYDPLNRLTSSVRIADAGTSPSEQFSYDASGNIIFLTRYNGRQKIDSLVCRYKNDGHQLVTVTDEGNDDDTYEVIEYHTEDMLADTSMWYDANGNLVYDEDRGISVIHYNVLNLPDTVQFINGNQIVNLYDAAGRKYKSITYIVPETAITPRYEIMQYGFDVDTIDYLVTEYAGTIENHYSRIDTTRRIHNAIGYYANNAYYHYIKDHLGNICAVVNSTADTVVQRTMYYASGVPMAQSWGRDTQPYLYNGKEFVEAHGWNTYDYGFRGYYAPIGRFTTIDPLAEQTPWQSPYSYAGNRFVNAIDWMGLGGITGFSHSDGTCHWVAIDGEGTIVGLDLEHWDKGVYEVDDFWDGSYWDLLRFTLIGDYSGCSTKGWAKGVNIAGQYNTGGEYYNSRLGCYVQHGTIVRNDVQLLTRYFYAQPSLAKDALNSLSKDFLKGFIIEGIAWDNFLKNNKRAQTILRKSGDIGSRFIKNIFNIYEAGRIGYDMCKNGVNVNNFSDAVTTALSAYLADVVAKKGISGLCALVGMDGIYALGTLAIAGVIAFPFAYVTAPAITDFNNSFGPEYWFGFYSPHYVPNSYLGF